MLILKRRIGQEVLIGGNEEEPIVIRLLHVQGKNVKVGVEAPSRMRIYRSEQWYRDQLGTSPQDQTAPEIADSGESAASPARQVRFSG